MKGQKVDGEKRKKNLSQILVCLVYVACHIGSKILQRHFLQKLEFWGLC